MNDCAIFLCCLNNNKIYCLEYTCLIISILIFPLNLLGLLEIKWVLIKFYCEIIYSINITISVFVIFIISLVIYSTNIGKIVTNEYYKSFISISLMSIFIFIYLFITYSLCSFQIFKDYINIHINNIYNNNYYSSKIEKQKLKDILKLKITWIILCISTLLPIILSFINILIWISIYYRIYFRIYCSFNKEIRKELREQRKKNKQFKKLEENNSINDINKNKEKNIKNFVCVVNEKDKHPIGSGFISNEGAYTKNNSNNNINNNTNKIHKNYQKKQSNQSNIISSERNFEKSNNIIQS